LNAIRTICPSNLCRLGQTLHRQAPIYLMLGLSAFGQSAVGDKLASALSPNTSPTLLGLGIALPTPPNFPPRRAAPPLQSSRRESRLDLPCPAHLQTEGSCQPTVRLLLCLWQAVVNHHASSSTSNLLIPGAAAQTQTYLSSTCYDHSRVGADLLFVVASGELAKVLKPVVKDLRVAWASTSTEHSV